VRKEIKMRDKIKNEIQPVEETTAREMVKNDKSFL